MPQTKTTPQWIIELRQTLKEEKRSKTLEKPVKAKKKPKRRKHPREFPDSLKEIKACSIAVHYASKNRNNSTRGEKAMDAILSESLTPRGILFSPQVPISRFIADFLVPKKRLVIEVDGEYHFFRGKEDQLRTKALKRLGYNVIRFTNHDVLNDAVRVRNEILERCVGPHAVLHLD